MDGKRALKKVIEQRAARTKRDVVLVGLKSKPSSRELLTWTLAKFTEPGDQVVALHVAMAEQPTPFISAGLHTPPTPHKDVNHIFNSVVGVYSSFCSIHEIDLQLQVVNNCSSVKKALVKEARHSNAVKLILGTTSMNPLAKDSCFSLAEYCSRHLPSSCSVLIIQHGRLVYSRPGTLTLGENLKKPNSTVSQQSMREKPAGETIQKQHCSHARKTHESEEQNTCSKVDCKGCAIGKNHHASHSAIHPFKYIPAPVQQLRPSVLDLGTLTLEPAKHPGRPSNGSSRVESFSQIHSTRPSIQAFDRGQRPSKDRLCDNPPGWPLLHGSISKTKMENPRSKSRSMSVVEWVLQLPERPKELQQRHSGPVEDKPSHCSIAESDKDFKGGAEDEASPPAVMEEKNLCPALTDKCFTVSGCKASMLFQIEDVQKATNNFSKDNIIGKGGCSKVYRGTLRDGHEVAVKCLNTSSASDSENVFLTELDIVSKLQHRHIVQLLGYCIDDDHGHNLLYNLASEGSLEQKLHHNDEDVLPWNVRHKVSLGTAEALEYLHTLPHPVIHGDLKSSNVVLLSDMTPQLTDFGLAKWAPTNSTHLICSDIVGTFGYLAPEYFMHGKVNVKTDVYSFGVVLLELVSGKHPIQTGRPEGHTNLVSWVRPLLENESTHAEVVDRRLQGKYDPDQLKWMMMAASLCLRTSPNSRPSMSTIVKALKGEPLESTMRQESMSWGNEDGDERPMEGDDVIHKHMALALCDLDDDPLEGVTHHKADSATNSNKFLTKYLFGRFGRSDSFDMI